MVFFSSGGPSGRLRSCPLPPPDSSKGGCALCKLLQQEVSQFRVQTKKAWRWNGKERKWICVRRLPSKWGCRRTRSRNKTDPGRRMWDSGGLVWPELSPETPCMDPQQWTADKTAKKPKPYSVGGLPVRCCGTSSTQTLLPLGNRGVVVWVKGFEGRLPQRLPMSYTGA